MAGNLKSTRLALLQVLNGQKKRGPGWMKTWIMVEKFKSRERMRYLTQVERIGHLTDFR